MSVRCGMKSNEWFLNQLSVEVGASQSVPFFGPVLIRLNVRFLLGPQLFFEVFLGRLYKPAKILILLALFSG